MSSIRLLCQNCALMMEAAEQPVTPLTFCQTEVNKQNSIYRNVFFLLLTVVFNFRKSYRNATCLQRKACFRSRPLIAELLLEDYLPGRGQMLLLSHTPSSLKGYGEQERCLKTEGKPVSLQYSKRMRRRTPENTGQSVSPPSLERQ